jgi:hypothetical protein
MVKYLGSENLTQEVELGVGYLNRPGGKEVDHNVVKSKDFSMVIRATFFSGHYPGLSSINTSKW